MFIYFSKGRFLKTFQIFVFSSNEACKKLDVSNDILRREYLKYGISRWPFKGGNDVWNGTLKYIQNNTHGGDVTHSGSVTIYMDTRFNANLKLSDLKLPPSLEVLGRLSIQAVSLFLDRVQSSRSRSVSYAYVVDQKCEGRTTSNNSLMHLLVESIKSTQKAAVIFQTKEIVMYLLPYYEGGAVAMEDLKKEDDILTIVMVNRFDARGLLETHNKRADSIKINRREELNRRIKSADEMEVTDNRDEENIPCPSPDYKRSSVVGVDDKCHAMALPDEKGRLQLIEARRCHSHNAIPSFNTVVENNVNNNDPGQSFVRKSSSSGVKRSCKEYEDEGERTIPNDITTGGSPVVKRSRKENDCERKDKLHAAITKTSTETTNREIEEGKLEEQLQCQLPISIESLYSKVYHDDSAFYEYYREQSFDVECNKWVYSEICDSSNGNGKLNENKVKSGVGYFTRCVTMKQRSEEENVRLSSKKKRNKQSGFNIDS